MNAGKLNRRIQIQTQTTTQDALGQQLQTWSTAYSCWASIDIQASQLLYSTAEFISKVTYRITLRWTSSVIFAASQRIVYTEPTTGVVHTYEIQAVLNDKAGNRQVILMCYELEGSE
ncbi:phage head closure protein [Tunturiibacter psychrotolerans]|uniref:phage head closure protein n=1 Tax=Tunturiibacter psychrotolerans TaxID=3069686 RepID=UPI003D1D543B